MTMEREATIGRPVCPNETLEIIPKIMTPIAPAVRAWSAVDSGMTSMALRPISKKPTNIHAYPTYNIHNIGFLSAAIKSQVSQRLRWTAEAIKQNQEKAGDEPITKYKKPTPNVDINAKVSTHLGVMILAVGKGNHPPAYDSNHHQNNIEPKMNSQPSCFGCSLQLSKIKQKLPQEQ